jgi:protein-tyrosine phosphatase
MNLPGVRFVKVGNGRIALYHRPKKTDFMPLREMGCTHVVTLLKESENAEFYGKMTKDAGLEWIWLSVPNGKYPQGEMDERLIATLPVLSQLLDDGKSLLIHCSAGIHRTGMVTYGLLRWRGVDSKEAMAIIREARSETAEGMMEKRMRWGDDIAQPGQKDHSWLHFAKEFVNRLLTSLSK